MIILQAHGIGCAVVRGHHLCMPLRCQNCKFATPSGENSPPKHTTIISMMTNLPLSSAGVPPHNKWGNTQQTKNAYPSPKTPPNTHSTFEHVGGVYWHLLRSAYHHLTNCWFPIVVWLLAIAAPSDQREQPQEIPTFGYVIVGGSLLCWCLVAIVQGCRPCGINLFEKEDNNED